MKAKLFLILLCVNFMSACQGLNSDRVNHENQFLPEEDTLTVTLTLEQSAHLTLTNFYDLLNQGAYAQAAGLYGGSYDTLRSYNPVIDPEEKAGLLEAGCKFNGFTCLKVLSAIPIQAGNPKIFEFEVTYANPDGSLFVLGPCCGETEENMPPQSTFIVHVTCENTDSCHVLDLPPYVP